MTTLIKIAILGGLYIFFTAFSMMLTGKNEFLSAFKANNYTINTFFIYLAGALILALGARLVFIAINYNLFIDQKYSSNAASISAAVTALSYIGVLICNHFYLGEPITNKMIVGFALISVGCFVCLT
jgi:hypothetical protein